MEPARAETWQPAPASEVTPEVAAAPAWGPVKRILFRFAFVYLLLYNLPFPLYYIPYVGEALGWYRAFWSWLVPWTATNVFGTVVTVRPNGSGDTTYNWVQVFCYLVLATAGALLWTLLDRRRTSYPRLAAGLRIYVRFVLAATMIGYGASKVIPSQFPEPPVGRMLQPFGDASPMGLLWTFMGASPAYTIFSGAAEMLGGLLLTFRRTALLGALVCIGVLTNVVMLNFCYDVPVKLYSSHLLLMAVFLAGRDLKRLADLLVWNRRAEPAVERPIFRRRWLDLTAATVRTLLVAYLVYDSLAGTWQMTKTYGVNAPKSPLFGIWNVEVFEADGKILPLVLGDAARWRRVVVDYPGGLGIQLMNDSRLRFYSEEKKGQVELTPRAEPNTKWTFAYRKLTPDTLFMQGTLDGRRIRARLRLTPPPEFRLKTRGFHWINEVPYNF
jgi:hypothetical protein